MPSIRLHGTSMVEYIYGDKFNEPARIIESVYDMRWRLAPNGMIFRLAENPSGSVNSISTNVKEIMQCTRVDVKPFNIDNCLTSYFDVDVERMLLYGGNRYIPRTELPPDKYNMKSISAFSRYRDKWVTLMGYIFPYVSFIGKDDYGRQVIRLNVLKSVSDIVTTKINSILNTIYSMYKEKSQKDNDIVPLPDKDSSHENYDVLVYRGRPGHINRGTPIFNRWIRFSQILYRRGVVTFRNNAVPTGILTASRSIQQLFLNALCEVTSLKYGGASDCGLFYDSRRSMIISLKLLMDFHCLRYTLVESVNKEGYLGSIYTSRDYPEHVKSVYEQDQAYLSTVKPGMDFIEGDLFDITFDSNEIIVDGIRIPFYE